MKKNAIFAACVVAVAVILSLVLNFGRAKGNVALVSIVEGETFTLPLEENQIYTFGAEKGARLAVTLEVKDGKIHFINSLCPDHICENAGWLSAEHEQAICLPAGVVVSVEAPQS